MATCIALLRGINVGRAKRIAMADLRQLASDLGYLNARTLLNSGNLVFEQARPSPAKIALALEAAIEAQCGFTSHVVVITATELNKIIQANPLLDQMEDPSRLLVAFASKASDLKTAAPLVDEDWGPDAFALGDRCAYLWAANGILKSNLMKQFERLTKKAATSRNWATVLKLQALTSQ